MELTVIEQKQELDNLINLLPTYRTHIRQMQEFLTTNNLELNQKGIQEYLKEVKAKYRNPQTINVKIASVKALLKLLYKKSPDYFDFKMRGMIEDFLDSLKLIKLNSVAVEKTKIITEEEIERLYERIGPKLKYLIQFFLATGLRVSEGLSIKLEDIMDEGRYYSITIIGKGNKARTVKVNKELVNSLKESYKGRTWLFESQPYKNGSTGGKPLRREYVSKIISEKTWLYLGRSHSIHDLRHTAITMMLKKTNRIKAVSSWAGHSSVSTTMNLYVHDELTLEELGI